MRIAISGAQHSGKSTLIDLFRDVSDITIYDSPSSRIQKNKSELSTSSTLETQLSILSVIKQDLNDSLDSKNELYDRCPLDLLVYSYHLYSIDKMSIKELEIFYNFYKDTIKKYRRIYLLSPLDIPIEENGRRSTDKEYQTVIFKEFLDFRRLSEFSVYSRIYVVEPFRSINDTIRLKERILTDFKICNGS